MTQELPRKHAAALGLRVREERFGRRLFESGMVSQLPPS
jgi:hypothetical protein